MKITTQEVKIKVATISIDDAKCINDAFNTYLNSLRQVFELRSYQQEYYDNSYTASDISKIKDNNKLIETLNLFMSYFNNYSKKDMVIASIKDFREDDFFQSQYEPKINETMEPFIDNMTGKEFNKQIKSIHKKTKEAFDEDHKNLGTNPKLLDKLWKSEKEYNTKIFQRDINFWDEIFDIVVESNEYKRKLYVVSEKIYREDGFDNKTSNLIKKIHTSDIDKILVA